MDDEVVVAPSLQAFREQDLRRRGVPAKVFWRMRSGEPAGLEPGALILLGFSRNRRQWHEALTLGQRLQPVREALLEAGLELSSPDQTKFFVHPSQHAEAAKLAEDEKTRPWHVVVAENYEHLVHASLIDVPYRACGRVKERRCVGPLGDLEDVPQRVHRWLTGEDQEMPEADGSQEALQSTPPEELTRGIKDEEVIMASPRGWHIARRSEEWHWHMTQFDGLIVNSGSSSLTVP